MKASILEILNKFDELYVNPECELVFSSDYELLVAVILSAQCTDKKVNSISPILFKKYPTLKDLKDASFKDLEQIIHPLGLSNVKAKNIIELSKILVDNYNSKVPQEKEKLTKLPGIGTKTANVMLIEYFKIPAFPVDTHVTRVSKRLNLCSQDDNTSTIEKKLTSLFPKETWATLHLQMVLFGRYICKAINPHCEKCLLKNECPSIRSNNQK